MAISCPDPMLIGSAPLNRSTASAIASAASSTYRNSRVAAPLPHTSTAGRPASCASTNFRIRAGMTWHERGSKLSPGPYRFVGRT